MTEADWCGASDPQPMRESLRGKVSDRKLRLFAVGCCRRFLPLTHDPRVGEALEIAERFADGLVGDGERSDARKAAQRAAQARGVVARPQAPKWGRRAASLAYYAAARQAMEAAWNVPGLAVEVLVWRAGGYNACDGQAIQAGEGVIQGELLRDLIGNPFRPATLEPAWLTPDVLTLAQAAYEQRILPAGTLDPALLSLLADALEEAGCTNQDVLDHLRAPGVHVRGCWAVDLVLAKE
jgi:hypothetical protein